MWSDERGVALPMIISLSIIMFLIVTITTSESIRNRQAGKLYWEMIEARYALESGISFTQAELKNGISLPFETTTKIGHFIVKMKIKNENPIKINATAYGDFGVKQKVIAELHPLSYKVVRWIK